MSCSSRCPDFKRMRLAKRRAAFTSFFRAPDENSNGHNAVSVTMLSMLRMYHYHVHNPLRRYILNYKYVE